jgi:hypothetical protein
MATYTVFCQGTGNQIRTLNPVPYMSVGKWYVHVRQMYILGIIPNDFLGAFACNLTQNETKVGSMSEFEYAYVAVLPVAKSIITDPTQVWTPNFCEQFIVNNCQEYIELQLFNVVMQTLKPGLDGTLF